MMIRIYIGQEEEPTPAAHSAGDASENNNNRSTRKFSEPEQRVRRDRRRRCARRMLLFISAVQKAEMRFGFVRLNKTAALAGACRRHCETRIIQYNV